MVSIFLTLDPSHVGGRIQPNYLIDNENTRPSAYWLSLCTIFGMQHDPIEKNTKMRRFWLAYIAAWLCAIFLYAIHYMS